MPRRAANWALTFVRSSGLIGVQGMYSVLNSSMHADENSCSQRRIVASPMEATSAHTFKRPPLPKIPMAYKHVASWRRESGERARLSVYRRARLMPYGVRAHHH
mmetsp:Transcript_21618/g.38129  ORF Transcript_21618/g.38129 Transcript_21618/m.38129 type:complete len:104 (-) Transcript_21618:28-339(-)